MTEAVTLIADKDGHLSGATKHTLGTLGVSEIEGIALKDIFRDWRELINISADQAKKMTTWIIPTKQTVNARANAIHLGDSEYVCITVDVNPSTSSNPLISSDVESAEIASAENSNNGRVNFSIPSYDNNHHIDLSEYAPQGLLLLTENFDYRYANRALLELAGRNKKELLGRGWISSLHSDDADLITEILRTSADFTSRTVKSCRIVNPLGITTWVRVSVRQISMVESPEAKYLIAFDDIDADKKQADKHHRLATFDTVTGLANRRHFEKTFEECVAKKSGGRTNIALLYIDLDGFKAVNDSHGHAVGDELLVAVANRLTENSTRATIVARLGGDEFVVLLTDIKRTEEVKYVAQKINVALAAPYRLLEHTTTISCSIGIAVHHKILEERRDTKRIVSDLLRRADSAMYTAKHKGKNQYFIYGDEKSDKGTSRQSSRLVRDIYTAIEQGDLFMEYQPQMETATGTVVGYEGLVRWQHPINGVVGPGQFIPLIETTGAMAELTIWITRRICFDYIKDLSIGNGFVTPSVSINLSAVQLQDKQILRAFDKIIRDEKINPSEITFEITESALISDPVAGRDSLEWLRDSGYKLSLDDFGTGYSSLSYLNQFPFDELKLDCSFIRDIETSEASRTLVSGIIQLAHSLNLVVTAEGVEKIGQLDYLVDQHCDRWQGYLKSKACSPAQIVAMRQAA